MGWWGFLLTLIVPCDAELHIGNKKPPKADLQGFFRSYPIKSTPSLGEGLLIEGLGLIRRVLHGFARAAFKHVGSGFFGQDAVFLEL